jgi:hypothetical protein
MMTYIECHRFPPELRSPVGVFPALHPDNFCGEWKERPTPAPTEAVASEKPSEPTSDDRPRRTSRRSLRRKATDGDAVDM